MKFEPEPFNFAESNQRVKQRSYLRKACGCMSSASVAPVVSQFPKTMIKATRSFSNSYVEARIKFLAAAFAALVMGCSPEIKDPVIEHAADVLQAAHINSSRVDWETMRLTIHLPPFAFNRERAIQHMIAALGEPHTFHLPTSFTKTGFQDTSDAASVKVSLAAIRAYAVDGAAVVVVPTFMHAEQSAANAYAQTLFDAVATQAEKQPRLWIIDLRGGGGGNMYPMLAGLSCFFDDDVLGYFADRFEARTVWRVKANVAGVEVGQRWYPLASVSGTCSKALAKSPLVVLIDGRTGSSSEAVAISLLSMERTQVYGQRTAGYATGNTPVPLWDGSMLLLTVAHMLDRRGKAFPKGIDPADYPARGVVVPLSSDSLKVALELDMTR
jgi:carboxyl-terminal processing protease